MMALSWRRKACEVLLAVGASVALGWEPLPPADDPLVRMPGSQPGSVSVEGPDICLFCHGSNDTSGPPSPYISPGYSWSGAMMAQAARDPIFYAAMTVAAQDSIWALGRPNAADLCLRCHFPRGWLAGRSDPPNGSAMTGADFDGVQCDFCHRLYDPFFEDTYAGTREGNDWTNYWDETNLSGTPSQAAADATLMADRTQAAAIRFFNGADFFGPDHRPVSTTYTENASAQYYVSTNAARYPRASFADANANHNYLYSRFHKSRYICATCHDVSNPVLANLGANPSNALPSEVTNASAYGHVERTFSEFSLSDYGQQGGAPGTGPFAPSVFATSRPGNYIAACQDCHMSDESGRGCRFSTSVNRPHESTEHPQSGQPRHDFTGGNVWVPYLLASTVSGSPNYDATNEALLAQGPETLTLDMTAGVPLDPDVLLSGVARATTRLERAASVSNLTYNPLTGACDFRVYNHTGHKLISGYPEGRRMFANIRAYVGGVLVYEVNPYDETAGTLRGLPGSYSPHSPPLGIGESYRDALVYEAHASSSLIGETSSFHFVLNDAGVKDNRIPPRGFRFAEAHTRQCRPVWNGVADADYFTTAEYAGGYDAVEVLLPPAAERVEVRLYYQSTSREYIEFLRDEINGTATSLAGTGAGGDASYLVQSDPFFGALKAWGDTIWQLWDHNRHVLGAAPVAMADQDLTLDTSDADGDGLPAYWETLFFGGATNAVPDGDPDKDYLDNRGEYLAFTDPLDGDSAFRIDSVDAMAGTSQVDVAVSFTSLLARVYGLRYGTNALELTQSMNVVAASRGTGARMTLLHTNSPSRLTGMYRLTIRLP